MNAAKRKQPLAGLGDVRAPPSPPDPDMEDDLPRTASGRLSKSARKGGVPVASADHVAAQLRAAQEINAAREEEQRRKRVAALAQAVDGCAAPPVRSDLLGTPAEEADADAPVEPLDMLDRNAIAVAQQQQQQDALAQERAEAFAAQRKRAPSPPVNLAAARQLRADLEKAQAASPSAPSAPAAAPKEPSPMRPPPGEQAADERVDAYTELDLGLYPEEWSLPRLGKNARMNTVACFPLERVKDLSAPANLGGTVRILVMLDRSAWAATPSHWAMMREFLMKLGLDGPNDFGRVDPAQWCFGWYNELGAYLYYDPECTHDECSDRSEYNAIGCGYKRWCGMCDRGSWAEMMQSLASPTLSGPQACTDVMRGLDMEHANHATALEVAKREIDFQRSENEWPASALVHVVLVTGSAADDTTAIEDAVRAFHDTGTTVHLFGLGDGCDDKPPDARSLNREVVQAITGARGGISCYSPLLRDVDHQYRSLIDCLGRSSRAFLICWIDDEATHWQHRGILSESNCRALLTMNLKQGKETPGTHVAACAQLGHACGAGDRTKYTNLLLDYRAKGVSSGASLPGGGDSDEDDGALPAYALQRNDEAWLEGLKRWALAVLHAGAQGVVPTGRLAASNKVEERLALAAVSNSDPGRSNGRCSYTPNPDPLASVRRPDDYAPSQYARRKGDRMALLLAGYARVDSTKHDPCKHKDGIDKTVATLMMDALFTQI